MILNECHDCHREVEMDTAERTTVLCTATGNMEGSELVGSKLEWISKMCRCLVVRGDDWCTKSSQRKGVGNKSNGGRKNEKDLSDMHHLHRHYQ
ncbi:hypothetical protein Tco_0520101 [Tanacetum coccineum]